VADIKVVSDLDATYTAAYLSDFTIKGAGWYYLDGTVATTTTCGSSQVIGGYPILAKDGSLLKTITNLESHSAYAECRLRALVCCRVRRQRECLSEARSDTAGLPQ
jgi:hypothetical protein